MMEAGGIGGRGGSTLHVSKCGGENDGDGGHEGEGVGVSCTYRDVAGKMKEAGGIGRKGVEYPARIEMWRENDGD